MLARRLQRAVDAESQAASPLCLVQDPSPQTSTTPVNLFWIVSRRQLDALLLVLNYPDQRNSREKVLILGHTSKQSPSWWTVRAAGAQSVCSHVMSTSGKGRTNTSTCAQLSRSLFIQSRIPHLPVQSRHFSQVSPKSVSLTASTALHTCLEALLLCTSGLFPADSIDHHKLFKARHDW